MKNRQMSRVLPILALVVALASPTAALAQDPDAAWKAGYEAFQQQDYPVCIEQMRTAFRAGGEAYERWGWLHMILGVCLGARSQRDEAISELQTAKELVSTDQERFEVNHNLAQNYVSRGNSGDYDRAIAAENEASQYAASAAARGLVSKTLGQAHYFKEDWRNAIQHLSAAAAARATDEDVAQKLGRAYLESGNSDTAMEWFQKTLQLNRNNPIAITNIGRLYLNEQNYPEAVRYLSQAVSTDPQNMQLRNYLGRAYLGTRDYPNAIQQLEQVVQANSSNGNAHYNLGQAYQAATNDGRAIDAFSNALNYLAGGSATRAECLYDMGFSYERVGNFEDSLQAFEDSAAISEAAKTPEAIERVKERIRRTKSGG